MRVRSVVIVVGCVVLGCAKPAKESTTAAPNPAFDQKWASLAQKDVDVFYIEDDRGEGLMGNVRRAKGGDAKSDKASDPVGTPATLSHDDVQRVIKQNLPGVRACYLRIARNGDQRSGKAIVSFEIDAAGGVRDTKVDPPASKGPRCPAACQGPSRVGPSPSPSRGEWPSATRSSLSAADAVGD